MNILKCLALYNKIWIPVWIMLEERIVQIVIIYFGVLNYLVRSILIHKQSIDTWKFK